MSHYPAQIATEDVDRALENEDLDFFHRAVKVRPWLFSAC
jgi:hypothetical protein